MNLKVIIIALLINSCSHTKDSPNLVNNVALHKEITSEPSNNIYAHKRKNITVFSSNTTGNYDIFLQREDLSRKQITFHKSDDIMPSLNKSGEQVAFISRRNDAQGDIYIKNTNFLFKDKPVRIKLPDSEELHPRWSQKGDHIIFSSRSYQQNEPEILIYSIKDRRINRTGVFGYSPNFTKDDDNIIYCKKGSIFIYNQKTKAHLRASNGIGFDMMISGNEQGTKFVYKKIDYDTNGDLKLDGDDRGSLWIYDLLNNSHRVITHSKRDPTYPSYSEKRILYSYKNRSFLNISSIGVTPPKKSLDFIFSYLPDYEKKLYFESDLNSQEIILNYLDWTILKNWKFLTSNLSDYIANKYGHQFSELPIYYQKIANSRNNKLCIESKKHLYMKIFCAKYGASKAITNKLELAKQRRKISDLITNETLRRYPYSYIQLVLLRFEIDSITSSIDLAIDVVDNEISKIQNQYPEIVRTIAIALQTIKVKSTFIGKQNLKSSWLNILRSILKLQQSKNMDPNIYNNQLLSILDRSLNFPYLYNLALSDALNDKQAVNFSDDYIEIFSKMSKSFINRSYLRSLIEEKHERFFKKIADHYLAKLELARAARIYKKTINIYPQSILLNKGLIDTYFKLGKINILSESYAQSSHGDNTPYLLTYLKTYDIDIEKDIDRRIEIIEDLIPKMNILVKTTPNAHLHQTMGWLYFQHFTWKMKRSNNGFFNKTKALFQRLGSQFSDRFTNSLNKAIRHYQLALAFTDEGSSQEVDLYQNLAEAQFKQGSFRQALYYYRKRIDQESLVNFSSELTRAQIFLNASKCASQARDYKNAESFLLQAKESFEKSESKEQLNKTQDLLALNYIDQLRFQEAQSIYRNRISELFNHDRNRKTLLANLGMSLFHDKKYRESIDILNTALNSKILYTEKINGEDKGIRISLGSQSESDGFSETMRNIQILTFLAKAYLKIKNYPEAIRHLEEKLSLLTERMDIYKVRTLNHLGYLHSLDGSFQKASNYFWQAHELSEKIGILDESKSNAINYLISIFRLSSEQIRKSKIAILIQKYSNEFIVKAYNILQSPLRSIESQFGYKFLTQNINVDGLSKRDILRNIDQSGMLKDYQMNEKIWNLAYYSSIRDFKKDITLNFRGLISLLSSIYISKIKSRHTEEHLPLTAYGEHLFQIQSLVSKQLSSSEVEIETRKSENIIRTKDNEAIVAVYKSDHMYIVYKFRGREFQEKIDSIYEVKNLLSNLPVSKVFLLINPLATKLFPLLNKDYIISFIGHPFQKEPMLDTPIARSIYFHGDTSTNIVKKSEALEETVSFNDQADILFLEKPIYISSQINSLLINPPLRMSKQPRKLAMINANIKDYLTLLAIDALRQSIPADSLLISTDEKKSLLVNYNYFNFDHIKGSNNTLLLGHFGKDIEELRILASNKSLSYKDPMINLQLAILTDNTERSFELLNILRNQRLSSRKFQGAFHYQRKILELVDEESDDLDLADEQLNGGIIALKADRFSDATSLFNKALKIYLDQDEKSQSAIVYKNMGLLDFKMKKYKNGIGNFKKARELFRMDNDNEASTNTLLDMANYTREYLNDFRQSLTWYIQAKLEFEAVGNQDGINRVNIDYANTLITTGRLRRAIKILESQRKILSSAKGDIWARNSLILLNAYYRSSFFEEAIFLYKEIKNYLSKNPNTEEHRTISLDLENTHALILSGIGRSESAKEIIKESMKVADKYSLNRKKAQLLSNLAYIERRSGNIQKSIIQFREALEIDLIEKNSKAIAFDYRNLGFSFLANKDYSQARNYLQQSLQESRRLLLAYNEVYSLTGLAELSLRTDEYTKAEVYYQQALEKSKKYFLRQFIWRSHAGLGETYFKMNRFENSNNEFEVALGLIDQLRGSLSHIDTSNGFQEDKSVQRVYEKYAESLFKQKQFELSWKISERSRARSLIDNLSNSKLQKSDPLILEYNKLDEVYKDLENLVSRGIASKEQESNLDKVKKSLNDFLLRMRVENPSVYSLIKIDEISIKDLQDKIDRNTLVIEYMSTPDQLLIWTISKDQITGIERSISRQELGVQVNRFRDILTSFGDIRFASKNLSKSLLYDIELDNNISHIIFIPHGSLHYLPFSALSWKENFLIDRFKISYLESATLAKFTLDKKYKINDTSTVVGIGNPSRGKNLDLPFAEKEVLSIKRYFPRSEASIKSKANKENFLSSLDKNVLHLASHGEFKLYDPSKSRLLLSGKSGDLTVDDIMKNRNNLSLVTLSACETGLGNIKSGDEIVSFNRAFFYSGAKSIISTLWRIDDVASAVTMKRFYRYLSEGNSKDEALRKAQLVAKSYFNHPAYWSSFKLVGSYH